MHEKQKVRKNQIVRKHRLMHITLSRVSLEVHSHEHTQRCKRTQRKIITKKDAVHLQLRHMSTSKQAHTHKTHKHIHTRT